jgi:hypothetical protein
MRVPMKSIKSYLRYFNRFVKTRASKLPKLGIDTFYNHQYSRMAV